MSSDHNDETLERARREIRALAATLSEQRARESDAAVPRVAQAAPERNAYVLGELTDHHHRAFLDFAYRALLKRAPEHDEAQAQLARLAAGTSKIEVLGDIAWSPEGRGAGVHVGGLRTRYLLAKARRVPLLGYLLDLALGIAGLPQQARHQRAVETYFAARAEAGEDAQRRLVQHVDGLATRFSRQIEALRADTALLRQRADDLHAYAHGLTVSQERIERALNEATRTLRGHIAAQATRIDEQAARIDELEFLRRRVHAMNRWNAALGNTFTRVEGIAQARDAADAAFARSVARLHHAPDAGRATRNLAWARALADRLVAPARVLVLGGDDDWDELLRQQGIEATPAGDASDGMTSELLCRCPDDSLDGIVALAPSTLMRGSAGIRELQEMHRTLRAGGMLLLAFAPECEAIVATLRGAPPQRDISLLASMLAVARFTDIVRIDAADGTPALLARKGDA